MAFPFLVTRDDVLQEIDPAISDFGFNTDRHESELSENQGSGIMPILKL